jgi:phosphoglycolate phosphatase-like HAD superfamily hydrolase
MRAVLFDYDGVLADTLDDMLRFAGESCAAMGFRRRPTRDDLDALETMSYPEYGRRLGIPDDRLQEFARRTMARFETRTQPPAIFPGMGDVVRGAAAGGQVAIVTNSPARAVIRFLEAHGIDASIDVLIPVEHPGSRADKLRSALASLGRDPGEAVFVGDAVSDVRACRQAGLRSIAVGWGHQRLSRLEAARPDFTVRSPAELLALLTRI